MGELEPLFADLPPYSPAHADRARRGARDRYVRAKLTLVAAGGAVWGAVALLQHVA